MIKKFHLSRLQKVVDVLKTVPPKSLDMSNWKCGTTCCAVGWACTVPSLRKAGLKLFSQKYSYDTIQEIVFYPIFGKLDGFNAIKSFFGLSEEEADELFGADSYIYNVTPKQVAARIQTFIKGKQNEVDKSKTTRSRSRGLCEAKQRAS